VSTRAGATRPVTEPPRRDDLEPTPGPCAGASGEMAPFSFLLFLSPSDNHLYPGPPSRRFGPFSQRHPPPTTEKIHGRLGRRGPMSTGESRWDHKSRPIPPPRSPPALFGGPGAGSPYHGAFPAVRLRSPQETRLSCSSCFLVPWRPPLKRELVGCRWRLCWSIRWGPPWVRPPRSGPRPPPRRVLVYFPGGPLTTISALFPQNAILITSRIYMR